MGLKKPSKQLPTLTNPAVADEIFYKKEAIDQNGEVMTGTVINVNSSTGLGTPSVSGSNLVLNSAAMDNGLHINKGGNVGLLTALSNLGDATAADVASGKTFTSAAGLKVTGTMIGDLVKVTGHSFESGSSTFTGNTAGQDPNCKAYKGTGFKTRTMHLVIYNNAFVGFAYTTDGQWVRFIGISLNDMISNIPIGSCEYYEINMPLE